jgi:hypothetical protein
VRRDCAWHLQKMPDSLLLILSLSKDAGSNCNDCRDA